MVNTQMPNQNNSAKEGKPGRLALVTGGGSGIGYAIARKFTAEEIRTIIVDRDSGKLDQAHRQLGGKCIPVCFDLRDLKSIPGLVRDLSKNHGRIDILVNNAGIHLKREFTEVTDEEFQNVLHTNLVSAFVLSREITRSMIEAGKGHILHISSMASQYGIPKVIAYTASKSALEGMTRAMAVELSPRGIRVNCIAPGFIATEMSKKAFEGDPERSRKVLSRTPLGELGSPEDIAEAAYFLVSAASGYMTGVVMPVDGGNSIGF